MISPEHYYGHLAHLYTLLYYSVKGPLNSSTENYKIKLEFQLIHFKLNSGLLYLPQLFKTERISYLQVSAVPYIIFSGPSIDVNKVKEKKRKEKRKEKLETILKN